MPDLEIADCSGSARRPAAISSVRARMGMGRAKKKGASSSGEFSLFDDTESADSDAENDLPRDEAGRAKIKHQYVDLLGIRVQKLAGRILNRERINKTL